MNPKLGGRVMREDGNGTDAGGDEPTRVWSIYIATADGLPIRSAFHEEQISLTAPQSRKTPINVRDVLPRSKCTTDILQ